MTWALAVRCWNDVHPTHAYDKGAMAEAPVRSGMAHTPTLVILRAAEDLFLFPFPTVSGGGIHSSDGGAEEKAGALGTGLVG